MILIPTANLTRYQQQASPEQWATWVAILRQYGQQTPDGWEVSVENYNAVSAARLTGVYDTVAYPPPVMPVEPEPVARIASGIALALPARSPCSGCGGAKYDPAAYNQPGGADALIQQLS